MEIGANLFICINYSNNASFFILFLKVKILILERIGERKKIICYSKNFDEKTTYNTINEIKRNSAKDFKTKCKKGGANLKVRERRMNCNYVTSGFHRQRCPVRNQYILKLR